MSVPYPSHSGLTENGFTPEFEAEVLAMSASLEKDIANKKVKCYKTAAELRAALDAEDEVDE